MAAERGPSGTGHDTVDSYMLFDRASGNAMSAYVSLIDAQVALRQAVEGSPDCVETLVLIGFDATGMPVGDSVTFSDLPPVAVPGPASVPADPVVSPADAAKNLAESQRPCNKPGGSVGVSPADTIRHSREMGEWIETLAASDMDGLSAVNINADRLKLVAVAEALLAVGERDKAEIERLTEDLRERDERLHRIHMFIDGLELRGIMNVAIEDVREGVDAAVLAGEEDAAND